MCLAVPGRLICLIDHAPPARVGRVDFGGVIREVNLTFLPEARPGDYVLVHVGFGLSVIDEVEAQRVFEYLALAGEAMEPAAGVGGSEAGEAMEPAAGVGGSEAGEPPAPGGDPERGGKAGSTT